MVRENEEKWQVSQLLFADDKALVADSEEQLRRLVVEFGRVCERRKLKVNVAKSKVMRCLRDGMAGRMDVSINGEMLEEVHTFYRKCINRASCNCGVAIQSGLSVIVVDKCSTSKQKKVPLTIKIYQSTKLNPRTKIIQSASGQQYEFRLPIGTTVYVKVGRGGQMSYINVWMKASTNDFNKTEARFLLLNALPNANHSQGVVSAFMYHQHEGQSGGPGNDHAHTQKVFLHASCTGASAAALATTTLECCVSRATGTCVGLCGTFDGNVRNDLYSPNGTLFNIKGRRPDAFSLSWRVMKKNSIYRGICSDDRAIVKPKVFCKCEVGKVPALCDNHLDAVYCPAAGNTKKLSDGKDITEQIVKKFSFLPACKSNIKESFEYDENYTPKVYEWEAGRKWNQEKAFKFCTQQMIKVRKACDNLPGVNIAASIENCVGDIKITDDSSWALDALDNVIMQCTQYYLRNVTKWETVDGNITAKELTFCINECSGNGKCVDGICKCDNTFTGPDCSISTNEAPKLQDIIPQRTDLAKISSVNISIVITGGPFYMPNVYYCYFKEAELQFPGKTYTNETDKQKFTRSQAIFISFEQIECILPTADSYFIFISSESSNLQSHIWFHQVFSSDCFQCRPGKICTLMQEKFCYIEGECYTLGTKKEGDVNLVCDSSKNITMWTDIRDGYTRLQSDLAEFLQLDALPNANHSESVVGAFMCHRHEGQSGSTGNGYTQNGHCHTCTLTLHIQQSRLTSSIDLILDFPQLTADVKLETSFNDSDVKNPEFSWICKWGDALNNTQNLEVHLKWFVDGRNVTSNKINDKTRTSSTVSHRQLLSYLNYGSSVFCALEACEVSKCPNQMSPLVKSNVFILELRLMNKKMVIIEEGGPSQMIGVQSTFPPFLICDQSIEEDKCFLELAINTMSRPSDVKCPGSKKIIPQVTAKWQSTNKLIASCFKTLTFFNWRVTQQIVVKATVDNIRDKDQIQEIEILLKNQNSNRINRTSLGKVKVKAIDTDKMALCKSLNDPHMTTFDGSYYNNFFEGPFNLYGHKTLPYGVQAFYRKCGVRNGASCNCAAAIRSGDDVIVFDRCGSSKESKKANKKLDIKLLLNKKLTKGTSIVKKNNGREYRVNLPTGTIVIIQVNGRNFINIQIQASTLDYKNVNGLCGSFDGNATNDLTTSDNRTIKHSMFPNNFSLSWRVNQSDSLYAGICLDNSEEEEQEEEENICSCMDGQEMCFPNQATYSCSQGGELITGLGKNILKDVQIISLDSNCSKENRSVFEYDKDFKHKEHSWPTPSGWTKDKALKYCQDTITNSASGKSCITVVKINFADAIKSCVEDIKISDGTTYALATLENMKIECRLETESNTTFWIRDNDGNTQLPKTIEKLCPLECSNGGKCVDGKCVCPKNKKGMDCSIDMKKPPEIDTPEIMNTCDVSKQNCSSVVIPGSNFIDDGSLYCYFQQITIYEKKVIYSKKNYIVTAQYLNFLSVSCKLPFDGSFFVRLTNNRLIFSIGFNFLRYEPQCVRCEEEMCEYKAGHCFIDEMCYSLGNKNPKDDKLYCDPDVSVNQWTKLAKYPVIETTLDIFTSKKENGNFDVVCQFNVSAKANVQHTLIWFAGSEELKQKVPVAEGRSILYSRQLTNFSLGMTIQCGIQSCFQDRCNDSLSPVRRSKTLFAGFKVDTKSLTVVEGEKEKHIKIVLTFPPSFFCKIADPEFCSITLVPRFQLKNEYRCENLQIMQAVVGFNTCQKNTSCCALHFTMDNWNQLRTLPIKAVVDSLRDKTQTRILDISASLVYKGDTITKSWVTNVKVTIVDNSNSGAVCKSINDPHMTTFDGNLFLIHDCSSVMEMSCGKVHLTNSNHTCSPSSTLSQRCLNACLHIINHGMPSPPFNGCWQQTDHLRPSECILSTKAEENAFQFDDGRNSVYLCLDNRFTFSSHFRAYNNFFEGEFVLYKHTTLPYAVHAFYKSCFGAASCNCAVAALSGDDVILIDGCGLDRKASKSSPFKIKMYVNGKLTPGTRVIRISSKNFKIQFPTGAYLLVKFRSWTKKDNFMNIWLYPSAFDNKKTLGLCGTFDGKKSDDFVNEEGKLLSRKAFSLSWRVKLEDTLYNGYCPEDSDEEGKEEEKPTDIYCNCANNMNESCSKDKYIFKCDRNIKKKKGTDITDLLLESKFTPMKCVVDVPPVNFTFDINYEPLEPVWPTPSGITKFNATQICETFITSKKSGKVCKDIVKEHFATSLESCIEDIGLTDDILWVNAALSDIKQICETEITTNPDLWVKDNATNILKPPQDIEDILCPNECSNQGNCSAGFCNCFEGYLGADCSINATTPPVLEEITLGMLCDTRIRNCSKVAIIGSNFVNTAKLTCHITEIKFVNGKMTKGSSSSVPAIFVSSNLLICSFQSIQSWEISVSFHKNIKSNVLLFFAFDSRCTTCNTNSCQERTDICRINGKCQEPGESFEDDLIKVCKPAVSKTQWTKITEFLQLDALPNANHSESAVGAFTCHPHEGQSGGTGNSHAQNGVFYVPPAQEPVHRYWQRSRSDVLLATATLEMVYFTCHLHRSQSIDTGDDLVRMSFHMLFT
uniref:VWFD domain-containing protein n=1 Tax=Octopus bimaculoides TaxID=37653 RepID=A0A0L8G0B6_OCTBM